ncbi:hypothetical protein GUJ93_ZPchr0001g30833 [Zizania palustris]|uniref:Uncharacterized protein n=1 Tax=Zizania palustris TaxID=103762 RepID=A0A8J5VMQ1_ZIZPA|nr:hypothetical protein GUJ93_ZPchr0001g30833 [Zizania palustris]
MARWLQLPCSLLLLLLFVLIAATAVVADDEKCTSCGMPTPCGTTCTYSSPPPPVLPPPEYYPPPAAARVLPSAAARVLPSAAGGVPSHDAVGRLPAAALRRRRRRRLRADAGLQPDTWLQPDAVGMVHAAELAVLPHPAGDALPSRPRIPAERGGGEYPLVARGGAHGGSGGRSPGFVISRSRRHGRSTLRMLGN